MGIIPGNKKQPEVKSESPVPAPTSLQTEDVKPASPTTEPGVSDCQLYSNRGFTIFFFDSLLKFFWLAIPEKSEIK